MGATTAPNIIISPVKKPVKYPKFHIPSSNASDLPVIAFLTNPEQSVKP